MRPDQLFGRIRDRHHDNVALADLQRLMRGLGFERVGSQGRHGVYAHPAVEELVTLQEDGGQAKRYQVRRVGSLVRQHDLQLRRSREIPDRRPLERRGRGLDR